MRNYYVHVVPRKCNNHARQKLYHLKIAVDHLCSTELAALVVGATLQLQKKKKQMIKMTISLVVLMISLVVMMRLSHEPGKNDGRC